MLCYNLRARIKELLTKLPPGAPHQQRARDAMQYQLRAFSSTSSRCLSKEEHKRRHQEQQGAMQIKEVPD